MFFGMSMLLSAMLTDVVHVLVGPGLTCSALSC